MYNCFVFNLDFIFLFLLVDFEKLKEISKNKDIIKLVELELNKKYIIQQIQIKETSIGNSLLVDLGDVWTWLPKRYNVIFTESAIKDVNENYAGKLYLEVCEIKFIKGKASAIINIDKL